MGTNFYRIWLPLSLVCHIGLYFLFQFVPIEAASIPGATKVALVRMDDVKPVSLKPIPPKPPKMEELPPQQPLHQTAIQPADVKKPGATRSQVIKQNGKISSTLGPKVANKPSGTVGPGKGKPSVAPKTITGSGSKTVPSENTSSDGIGTGAGKAKEQEGGGDGGGGETRGAVATYKPAPSSKDAENGTSGTVIVRVTVDTDGRVTSAQAISGNDALFRAACRAARRAKFSPALRNGKPVESTYELTYNF